MGWGINAKISLCWEALASNSNRYVKLDTYEPRMYSVILKHGVSDSVRT